MDLDGLVGQFLEGGMQWRLLGTGKGEVLFRCSRDLAGMIDSAHHGPHGDRRVCGVLPYTKSTSRE